jgi:hypothetical protein
MECSSSASVQGISGTASVVGNQNGEHLNGDQFLQNRFRVRSSEEKSPAVQLEFRERPQADSSGAPSEL